MNKNLNFNWIRKNWSLIAILPIFWVTIFILLIQVLNFNQFHFTYILDDTYIHMAMAKNFAEYGVWGVTKYSFSSSTSSILWVLLLSVIYKVVGVNDITPFILNVLFASGSLVLIYWIFNKCRFPQWYSFMVMLAVVFLASVPLLVFTGMEHNLQIPLVIGFVYMVAKLLSSDVIDKRGYWILLILAILLSMIRYESMVLIGIVFALFLLKKRYFYSIILLGVSLVPMITYGLISMANGWPFFPSSLMVKSIFVVGYDYLFSSKGFFMLIYLFQYNVEAYLYLVLFLFISIAMFLHFFNKKLRIWDFKTILLIIFVLLTFVNLVVLLKSSINDFIYWYSRYDAYLIILGLIVLSISFKKFLPENPFTFKRENWPKYIAIFLLLVLLLSPFTLRVYSMKNVPQASNNIYEQQYQMGLFLQEYYAGETIALNDLGAISYLADLKIVDLCMLGSMEMLPYFKTEQNNNPNVLAAVTKEKNVKICVVYDQAFKSTPPGWIIVAEWKIPNNIVCSYDTVSFYATSAEEAQKLLKNLKSFSSKLPSNIEQKYFI